MTELVERVRTAAAYGMHVRPKVGGFPYLAEALRRVGVLRYEFDVPSSTVLYVTADGAVLQPGTLIASQPMMVPSFDVEALVAAIRSDQRGDTDFPTFVERSFAAGVVRYTVDTTARTCTYRGVDGAVYVEEYPLVDLPQVPHETAAARSSLEGLLGD